MSYVKNKVATYLLFTNVQILMNILLQTTVMGGTVLPQISYVEVPMPHISECDCILEIGSLKKKLS